MRLRLDLAYDGTAYSGWARQPDRATVQGVVEKALSCLCGETLHVAAAGRTDAGVHATGQVCHADLSTEADPSDLVRRLNRLLPPDVRVLAGTVAPPAFDARFSALSRTYRYRVSDAPYGALPLRRHDTAAHPRPLSLRLLRTASRPLLGEHDFAAFCRRREGATTVRTLRRLSWVREGDGVLVATVEADAFCHQMVRSLVGTLLPVGDGRRSTAWPAEVLVAGSRARAAAVAPAHGLTLVTVRYPPSSRLGLRASVTRRRRDAGASEAQ